MVIHVAIETDSDYLINAAVFYIEKDGSIWAYCCGVDGVGGSESIYVKTNNNTTKYSISFDTLEFNADYVNGDSFFPVDPESQSTFALLQSAGEDWVDYNKYSNSIYLSEKRNDEIYAWDDEIDTYCFYTLDVDPHILQRISRYWSIQYAFSDSDVKEKQKHISRCLDDNNETLEVSRS